MELRPMDSCTEGGSVVDKSTSVGNSIENEAKNTVLANGVDEDVDIAKADSLNIDHKMAELQVTIENELNSLENDEGSPKLDDALTDEQKIELKMVLSNYFSHEYLSKDKFLISQMDYDQFISISIVAGLEEVKRITQNLTVKNKLDAVVKTLQEIQFVQLSEGNSKVRRIIERSTLLLREIPKSVPEKDIREIFANSDCPSILACEYAHNDSWYVHFGSEEDANRAYKFLRESGKSFMNRPILARFKGKSALTGSYIPPQSSEMTASVPGPVSVPRAQNTSSSVMTVPYLQQSGYAYSYPEQTLTYYPDFYPGLTLGYNAFSVATCPVVSPMNLFYPAPGDQTTVEVINNRQRKLYNRGGLYHHSRPDPGIYNEHKQPPRFNRKRDEGRVHDGDEHQHSIATASWPSTSHVESHSSPSRLSSKVESSQIAHNSSHYPQRRGTYRGGRRGRHQEGGGGVVSTKCRVSDGPKPFELETSSFPPLSSGQVTDPSHPDRTESKAQAAVPRKAVASNRVDQSTTTDGDFENPRMATSMPVKFSYAQIAKRSVKEDTAIRNDASEHSLNGAISVDSAAEAFDPNSGSSYGSRMKETISPKERKGGKLKQRPPKPPHNEEVAKLDH